jgi:hypothetical protein
MVSKKTRTTRRGARDLEKRLTNLSLEGCRLTATVGRQLILRLVN